MFRNIYDNNQEQGLFTAWKKCEMKYLIENDLADNYKEIETIEKDMELDI